MAPSPKTTVAKAKATTKEKKEKLFHPQSRKAGQLERSQLRKAKLATAATKKGKKESAKIDKFVFFYHAIPPEAAAVTLEELHVIVQDIWLKRHDSELEKERSVRRKGRPKSSKQMLLEELLLRETEEYRTGLEVPDITHAPTVKLFRRWGQTGVGYLDLLRFIRINSEDPTSVVISRPGKHMSLHQTDDIDMDDSEAPLSDGPAAVSPTRI
ncbi:hypothetical protein BU17DRAFT_76307 [Hysterangium stoloniferum]|nr:hypothetical protein BU17DRAFT_76307 [Hysterangium stoloniferum]